MNRTKLLSNILQKLNENLGKKEKKNCSRCQSQKPSGSVHAVGKGWWGQQEVSGVWWTRWWWWWGVGTAEWEVGAYLVLPNTPCNLAKAARTSIDMAACFAR